MLVWMMLLSDSSLPEACAFLVLAERDEIVEHGAGDAERDGAERHAEHVEDREEVERPGLAPVGVGFAREAVGLRHEQVGHLIVVAAGAAQPDHLPGIGDLRLRFREIHGARIDRLAVRSEARTAVRFADRGMPAKPLRMAAAAGEMPMPGHAIAAVGDDGLGRAAGAPVATAARGSPNNSFATSGAR